MMGKWLRVYREQEAANDRSWWLRALEARSILGMRTVIKCYMEGRASCGSWNQRGDSVTAGDNTRNREEGRMSQLSPPRALQYSASVYHCAHPTRGQKAKKTHLPVTKTEQRKGRQWIWEQRSSWPVTLHLPIFNLIIKYRQIYLIRS